MSKNKTKKPVGKGREIIKCDWCNKVFTNRGNLANHTFKIHGVRRNAPNVVDRIQCHVCSKTVQYEKHLIYHIRKEHYNMKAKVPYFHIKKLNQIWFEKLFDTNTVMRMQKIGENIVSIQKLNSGDIVNVHEGHQPELDVSNMYPCSAPDKMKKKCPYCNNVYIGLKKHIEERHLNIKNHRCNNCNRMFKRLYLFLRHDCYKTRRKVTRCEGEIKTVRNLKPVEVESER